ncbi:SHOCT domain-containing protein [Pseudactinotalea suaedae]|jgi:putative membrane protein|uniref:SHOCT domain-containing protein n=1 Tax=Pseudactinotalea suaedae TaxID=1524924 RepID=UPI001F4FC8A2|nr:SHOCT domain-containing protein [Pseudactinotalea suaedae]
MEMLGEVLADGPWRYGAGPGPFLLFPLLWLLAFGGVIAAVVLGRRRRDALAGTRAGERVLAERFAQGEITVEDYRARLAELRAKP